MKRANRALQIGFGILLILFTVGSFLAPYLGYAFIITSIPVYGFLMAVWSLSILVLEFLLRDAKWVVHLLPISVLTSFMCIFRCREPFVIGCTLVATGCLVVISLRYKKHGLMALSAVLLLTLVFLGSLFSMLDGLSVDTVVQTIPSPDGSYYAQVIDSDQGAMGGRTVVEICPQEGLDALLFRIQKKSWEIYSGPWGEAEYLRVRWKDNNTLEINSVLYPIQ